MYLSNVTKGSFLSWWPYFLAQNKLVCLVNLVYMCEEEKEENLNYHSEKITLAYGILKSSPRSEVRIQKNIRIPNPNEESSFDKEEVYGVLIQTICNSKEYKLLCTCICNL